MDLLSKLMEELSVPVVIGGSALGVAAIMLGLARVGGWHALAQRYPVRQPFLGDTFSFQSVQLAGWVGYNNCVTAGADPYRLYLSLWPFLAIFGHPPLAIPWTDVIASREKKSWLASVVLLKFLEAPAIRLRMSSSLAARLAVQSRGGFTVLGDPPAAERGALG